MWELARNELYLRRHSTVLVLCLVSLAVVVAASLLPRTWTARAVLELQAKPPEYKEVESRLRSRFERDPESAIHATVTSVSGNALTVSLTAARPQEAVDALNSLLSLVVNEEIERLRDGMRGIERGLLGELEQSQARVSETEARINEELGRQPEGGESALGARFGQLRGEREALDTELRSSEELRRTLAARIATLDGQIAGIRASLEAPLAIEQDIERLRSQLASERAAQQPDPARIEALELQISLRDVDKAAMLQRNASLVARLDTILKPEREQTATRLRLLENDTASKAARRKEIDRLLGTASAELAALQQGSQKLRDLQREFDDAVALNRQIKLRVQGIQSDILLRANAASIPFVVARYPVPPDHPDGIPSWVIVVCSLGLGALLAAALNLGRIVVDDRVRAPESVRLDAQVEVLAVIPEYVPLHGRGRIRWRAVGLALLAAGTAGTLLAFLALF